MNKVLVITGGSKGIDLATCRRFAQQGYRGVNLSRSAHPMKQVEHLTVDLSKLDWIARHGAAIVASVQGADSITLVHNAAMAGAGSTETIQGVELQRVLQLNVVAAVQLNGLLLAHMQTGSSILYVGSTLSEKAVPGACSYIVSKHAQLGLMRSTCQDLMGRGIHTATVCPGFTDTEMLRTHVGDDETVLQAIAAMNSFGRLVRPQEIADTLLFCADNPVINGTVIHANLGQKES
jgi:3-oxoacyl-[acyl-carrier protein] reductase